MACLKFRTKWAINETLKTLEDISFCRFVHHIKSKQFGNDDWKPSHNLSFHWDWNVGVTGAQTATIPFDGIPFAYVGFQNLNCHRGVAHSKHSVPNLDAIKANYVSRTGIQMRKSKKIGCPATIRISRIAKFPQFRLINKITQRKKKEVIQVLKQSLSENPSSVKWSNLYYVCLPTFKEHIGHPVTYQAKKTPSHIRNLCPSKNAKEENSSYLGKNSLEKPNPNGLKKLAAEFKSTLSNDSKLAALVKNLEEILDSADPASSPCCNQSFSVDDPIKIIVETDDFTQINLPIFNQSVSPSVVEIAVNEDAIEL